MNFIGTNSNDTRQGTAEADTFDMTQGGVDTVNGNGGDDEINFGATLTAADRVNGGEGEDTLVLTGDYSAGLTFNSTTVRFVEKLEMTAGFAYDITTSNNTVAAGQVMTVSAYNVGFGGSGHFLHFNGAAETDGRFNVSDSYGNDIIIGSQGSDSLSMAYGGIDLVDGQGGNDVLMAENNFGAGDVFDGGAGADIVYFRGPQAGQIDLNGGNFKNIETLAVSGNNGASFLAAATLLTGGQMLNIDVRTLAAGQTVIFNASQVADGWFDFYDGASNDLFTGGAGADLFRAGNGAGNSGSDLFSGLGGDDSFAMGASLDSSDIIYGGAGYDTIDLQGDYSAGLTFGGDGLASIERFTLRTGFTYKLYFNDGNLNTGEGVLISGDADLGAGKFLYVDASAESDASYTVYDTNGNDTLLGGGGADTFWLVSGGKDKVNGGGGDDNFTVYGTLSNGDAYNGGAGIDRLSLYYATDAAVVNLASGHFTVGGVQGGSLTQVENAWGTAFNDTLTGNNVANSLFGDGGNDTLKGNQGNDELRGGDGNDDIAGDSGADYLDGGIGNDTLDGGTQDDTLAGGEGKDWLLGGTGNDDLTGGGGRDTFVFVTGGGVDTIRDFTNNLDYLDFSASSANSFADIQPNMVQVGADVEITLGADKFILEGFDIALLNAADFLF